MLCGKIIVRNHTVDINEHGDKFIHAYCFWDDNLQVGDTNVAYTVILDNIAAIPMWANFVILIWKQHTPCGSSNGCILKYCKKILPSHSIMHKLRKVSLHEHVVLYASQSVSHNISNTLIVTDEIFHESKE
jgi:hypothetical protein